MSESTKKYYTLLPWIMLSIGISFYFYEFVLQVSPSVMTSELKQAFSINNAGLGILGAVYFCGYAGMQIPMGILLDHIGPRRLLTSAALCCAIGAILFGTVNIFAIALAGRFLIGLGSAVSYIGCAYIAANWFPINRFATILGFIIAIGMLGAVGGQAPLAYLVAHYNWHNLMLVLGIIGIAISLLFLIFIRDKNPIKPKLHKKNSTENKLLTNIKHIVKNKQVWLCAIYGGCMYTPILVMGTIWGDPFIALKYKISTTAAAGIISSLYIGFAIGAPILGWLSDHFRRRNIFMFFCSLLALLFLALTIYIPTKLEIMDILYLFLFGFFSGGFLLIFSTAREINPPHMVGTAMGFMNGFNMIGGAILIPIIGLILNMIPGSSEIFHYKIALSILLIIQILAIIMISNIKETHAKPLF